MRARKGAGGRGNVVLRTSVSVKWERGEEEEEEGEEEEGREGWKQLCSFYN